MALFYIIAYFDIVPLKMH